MLRKDESRRGPIKDVTLKIALLQSHTPRSACLKTREKRRRRQENHELS